MKLRCPDRRQGRLTSTQEQIWRLDREHGAAEALNMAYALRIEGPLSVPALAETFQAICRRHEPLRTLYPEAGGRPIAQVQEESSPRLAEIDLRPLPSTAERLGEAARLAVREARHRFDLSTGPLLRACLLRLAEEENLLLVNLHHISADGWSLDIFGRECGAIYAALVEGRPASLPELAHQCVDHAEWQADWLLSAKARRQLDWWKGYLDGVSPAAFALPGGAPGPVRASSAVSRQTVPLSPDLLAEIQAVGRRRGASLYMM
ncbi:MAG: condensation domain-containing protein, partial [Acidobacteriota bacterium]|nr:condensation domain-containing protein [Acidobacteriota bacterium]